MTKRCRHILLILGLCLISAFARAQAVSFRLEIPAGVSFPSRVLEPVGGKTWENDKALVWIEILAQENLGFLLDLDFPEGEIEPQLEAFFLNDGTASYENAKQLLEGIQELQMINPPKLIRNADLRPPHYQAWLGLPVARGITVKIEYP